MTTVTVRGVTACALLLLTTGCASVVSRSHPNHDRWYPGVKQDWRDLSIDPWYSQTLDLVDLPLSAVGDTVLLPWDAIVRDDHRGPEAEPAPEPAVETVVSPVIVPAPTPVAAPPLQLVDPTTIPMTAPAP